MGDLFHEAVPYDEIDRIFAVMALSLQHTFVVLTKRPEKMREYMASHQGWALWEKAERIAADNGIALGKWHRAAGPLAYIWPLSNVVLGVSVEDQKTANERVPILLDTPAATRIVSYEPALGPVDWRSFMWPVHPSWPSGYKTPEDAIAAGETVTYDRQRLVGAHCTFIDGIIMGGESGQKARPMHPDWGRQTRDQCERAGVPFFFKRWGKWAPLLDRDNDDPDWRLSYANDFPDRGKTKWLNLAGGCGFHGDRFHVMQRVGKATAGRLLDGSEHNDLPWRVAK